MRPTLRQMEYFVTLSDVGSFSKAARLLGVSQPALSAQFAEMEASLGTTLLERRNRGVLLTESGKVALAHCEAALDHVRRMREAVQERIDPFSGTLKLGVLPSIGAYFLPGVARQLHAKYPRLRLQIAEGGSKVLESGLCNGDYDVILSSFRPNAELESTHLFDETLWVCAALEDELMLTSAPLPITALKGRTLISIGDGFGLNDMIEQIAERAQATVSRSYRGNTLDASRQMAVMGAGIAVLPSLYALNEAKRDTAFVVRKIDDPAAVHPVFLVWRQSSPLQQSFRQLATDLLTFKQGMELQI